MEETWIVVFRFENYAVSDLGRIKRIKPGVNTYIGRILKPQKNKRDGYYHARLNRDGKLYTPKVHRIVALAFLGEPASGLQVNHKDGDKGNNALANLEYVTQSENIKHSYAIGTRTPLAGSKNGFAKLTEKDIPLIWKLKKQGYSGRYIGKRLGVSSSAIYRVLNQERWGSVVLDAIGE